MFGSTELGNAGVGSDIDLIIVSEGNEQQHREFEVWLEGWSLCVAEISFQLYGLPRNGLLDVKFLNPDQARSEIPSLTAAGKTLQALPVGAAPLSKTQSRPQLTRCSPRSSTKRAPGFGRDESGSLQGNVSESVLSRLCSLASLNRIASPHVQPSPGGPLVASLLFGAASSPRNVLGRWRSSQSVTAQLLPPRGA
ncbi:MAG: nucleotidyltransferase domain-containing protein [Acidobacteriaceae bacterium]